MRNDSDRQDTSMKYATSIQQIGFRNFDITFSKHLNAHFKVINFMSSNS